MLIGAPPPPPVIGLLGRSRVGKDTVAAILAELFPVKIARLSTPVKEAAAALYHLSEAQINGGKDTIDPRYGTTPRSLIQELTQFIMDRRGIDHFTRVFWDRLQSSADRLQSSADRLQSSADRLQSSAATIVIPDIRYAHDIDEVRARGGVVFKIERDIRPISFSCEDAIDHFPADVVFKNNGSVEDLSKSVRFWWGAYKT